MYISKWEVSERCCMCIVHSGIIYLYFTSIYAKLMEIRVNRSRRSNFAQNSNFLICAFGTAIGCNLREIPAVLRLKLSHHVDKEEVVVGSECPSAHKRSTGRGSVPHDWHGLLYPDGEFPECARQVEEIEKACYHNVVAGQRVEDHVAVRLPAVQRRPFLWTFREDAGWWKSREKC
ncbi:hypothetical protein B0H13DRAFT_1860251 [Mycena leptocephala]|nr:hypothetical protein B0H13DRAFT_1860251 [Mycena leptocephala]